MRKIILKTNRFEGGASLSLLEYGKLLLSEGYEIIAVGDRGSGETNYRAHQIRLVRLAEFDWWSPVKNIIATARYIRLLRIEKPSLIITIAFNNCIFHRIVERITGLPVVRIIPGGEIPRHLSKALGDAEVIVFSEENRQALARSGYRLDKITLITNRLATFASKPQLRATQSCGRIQLLLISRLDKDKIAGILALLAHVEKLVGLGANVHLSIIGAGALRQEIESAAQRINRQYRRDVVTLEGYATSVSPYIEKADIVFGKGRSVLDAVLSNRLAFVIAEDGGIFCCRPERIHELSETNFTGRGMGPLSDFEYLVYIVNTLSSGGVVPDWVEASAAKARGIYSIETARSRIIDYMQARMSDAAEPCRVTAYSVLRGLFECFRLYCIRISSAASRPNTDGN